MHTRALVLIFVALACGMAASIGVSQLISHQRPTTVRDTAKRKIYVALHEVEAGNALSEDNVGLEPWFIDNIPDGAIERLEDLTGKFAQQRFFVGEPIIRGKLSDTAGTTTVKIPAGFRAVPVKVSVESGGLGIIAPGDHVDVLVCVRRDADIPAPIVRTILRDARVFSVGDVTERYQDRDGKLMQAQTVSLLLKPRQDEAILLAGEVGRLQLILRRPNEPSDNASPDDELAALEQLLREARGSSFGHGDERIPVSTPIAPETASHDAAGATSDDSTQDPDEGWVMTVYTPEGVKILRWRNGAETPVEQSVPTDSRSTPVARPRPAAGQPARAPFDTTDASNAASRQARDVSRSTGR